MFKRTCHGSDSTHLVVIVTEFQLLMCPDVVLFFALLALLHISNNTPDGQVIYKHLVPVMILDGVLQSLIGLRAGHLHLTILLVILVLCQRKMATWAYDSNENDNTPIDTGTVSKCSTTEKYLVDNEWSWHVDKTRKYIIWSWPI